MPRYITRPRADMDCDGWDAGRLYDNITVSLADPIDTGLLDNDGNTIWRVNDPIGFRFGDGGG